MSGAERADDFVYDAANECIVIGAAVASEEVRRDHVRSVGDHEFLAPGHAAVWRALRRMENEGLRHDAAVWRRYIVEEGGEAGAYLDLLEEGAAVPANLAWHVATMRWDATRARALQGPVAELIREIRAPRASRDAVMAASLAVARCLETGGRRYMKRAAEQFREYEARLAARRTTGLWSFGWRGAMDSKFTYGVAPRRTAVLAGLSGGCKSTFGVAFAIEQAKLKRRVLYGAYEMDVDDLIDIAVAQLTGLSIRKISLGALDEVEESRVKRAAEWVTGSIKFMENAFFDREQRERDAARRRSNDSRLDLLEGYLADAACDVVVLDLWERALCDLSYDGVTNALVRQQQMHKDLGCYGMIVQQLRLKDVETRTDKRPTRESIKGTGAYVEVSDQIFGTHRDAQFKRVPDDSVELICLKQRKGPAFWSFRFKWNAETNQLRDPEEVSFDPGTAPLSDGDALESIDSIAVNRPAKKQRKPGPRDSGR